MSIQTDNKGCSLTGKKPNPRESIAWLWRAFIVRNNEELDARNAASTLFRFFRSNHVRDLNLIFTVALVVFVFQILLTIIPIFIEGTSGIATAGGDRGHFIHRRYSGMDVSDSEQATRRR
jgi:hypothetical protein